MGGIGMQEVLIVLILALIVIGPKKLPEVAKALGKGYGEFRRAFEDMKSRINVDMKTEEEKRRIQEIHDRVQPPPEDETPKPEPLVTPSTEPEVVAGDKPVPKEQDTPPEEGEEEPKKKEAPAPTLPEYEHQEGDIEGG